MGRFSAGLSAGFAFSLVLLGLVTREWEAARFRADPRVLTRLPTEWYDASTRTPAEADRHRQFWLAENDWNQQGLALRLLQNRSLLESFFPGYGEAAGDSALWDIYFRDDTSGYSPLRSPRTELSATGEYAIRARLFGAMELFARHGADIVVLGSSKAFCAVIPGLLAQAVKTTATPDPKVVMIGKDAFFVPGIVQATEALSRRIPRKARLAILSVSWNDWSDQTAALGPRFDRFKRRGDPSPDAEFLLRPLLDWRSWAGIDLYRHLGVDGAPWLKIGEDSYVLADDAFGRALALFPRKDEMDPDFVRTISETAFQVALPYTPVQDPGVFDLKRAREEIARKILGAKKVAERVLLFFPPESPASSQVYPRGFLPAFKEVLRDLAGPGVAVIEEDWNSYGLSPLDLVHAGWPPGRAYFQSDHLNGSGARKVTEKLGRLARAALR